MPNKDLKELEEKYQRDSLELKGLMIAHGPLTGMKKYLKQRWNS